MTAEGPLAPPVPSGVMGDGEQDGGYADTTPHPAPESNVRMVQLFFTTASYPTFDAYVRQLATHYGTTTVTDTVLECLFRARTSLD